MANCRTDEQQQQQCIERSVEQHTAPILSSCYRSSSSVKCLIAQRMLLKIAASYVELLLPLLLLLLLCLLLPSSSPASSSLSSISSPLSAVSSPPSAAAAASVWPSFLYAIITAFCCINLLMNSRRSFFRQIY